jgi:hypothetical protein
MTRPARPANAGLPVHQYTIRSSLKASTFALPLSRLAIPLAIVVGSVVQIVLADDLGQSDRAATTDPAAQTLPGEQLIGHHEARAHEAGPVAER